MMMITVAKTTRIWKTKFGLMLELLPPNRFDRCLKRNLASAFESVNFHIFLSLCLDLSSLSLFSGGAKSI